MNKLLLIFFTILLSSSCISPASQVIHENVKENHLDRFPAPVGNVNDFASVLDSIEEYLLEDKLKHYELASTNQIVIISINDTSLNEENFDKSSIDISNHWKVGQSDKLNGLTIVFSPALRKVRINTGIGTEKILTDEICYEVYRTIIVPRFQNQEYFEGLNEAIDEFIKIWK